MQKNIFPEVLARPLRRVSGLRLIVIYFGFALVVSLLVPVLGVFASALVSTAYFAWLQFCVSEVSGSGRVLSENVSRFLALPVLWGFSLIFVPILLHAPWRTALAPKSIEIAASLAFVISLFVVADNIASAVARSQVHSGRKWLVYGASLLCLMSAPAGVLFMHSRVVSVRRKSAELQEELHRPSEAV